MCGLPATMRLCATAAATTAAATTTTVPHLFVLPLTAFSSPTATDRR
jgi:hypothetical protein